MANVDYVEMECNMLIEKLQLMVDQTKKNQIMDKWVHMPPTSFEYKYIIMRYVECLRHSVTIILEELHVLTAHLEKAREIYNILGMKVNSKEMEDRILMNWAATRDEDVMNTTAHLVAKSQYNRCVESFGLTADKTIRASLWYAEMLELVDHAIEAECLLMKITVQITITLFVLMLCWEISRNATFF